MSLPLWDQIKEATYSSCESFVPLLSSFPEVSEAQASPISSGETCSWSSQPTDLKAGVVHAVTETSGGFLFPKATEIRSDLRFEEMIQLRDKLVPTINLLLQMKPGAGRVDFQL